MSKRISLEGFTEEEKKERLKQQKREAQRRYYQKNRQYYIDYVKERHKTNLVKYRIYEERIDEACELIDGLLDIAKTYGKSEVEDLVKYLNKLKETLKPTK